MNNKTKWIMAGTLAVALVVGLTLGAMAVAFVQRAVWGYSPAYAANGVSDNGQNWQNYSMPGPMMQGGPRWGGGHMMSPPNFRGRGPQGDFGPGMMGRGGGYGPGGMMGRGGDYGPGMMGRGGGYGPGMMGRGGDYGHMMGAGPGWGGANSLVAIAAEKLGMTTAELITELKSGKTIAELAKEKDVSLDSLVEAVLAPHLERMAVMVSNGVITQEQADAMTELMKANITARLNGEVTPGTCPGLGDTDGDSVCDYTGRGPRGGGRGMMWR